MTLGGYGIFSGLFCSIQSLFFPGPEDKFGE